ncbi:hypothetical protein GQ54DRAFT_298043 [Martensiomyces pterosporus]|nr:hypothetical protein GQ54DRAFT_298043 [Martensiomyces pterosporus]
MAQASLAQTLPEDIIEDIIFYATNLRKLRRTQAAEWHPELCQELMPLLGVCRHWRSVALPVFYLDLFLTTNDDVTAIDRPLRFFHGLTDVITNGAEHFIRCARIQVPMASILEGKVVDLLSAAPYTDAVFPSAVHLTFGVFGGGDPEGEVPMFKENAAKFCERILRLFPNVESLNFDVRAMRYTAHDEIMGDIVTGLTKARRLGAFDYSGVQSYLHVPELTHLATLSRISLFVERADGDIIELVHRNAPTLEYIEIRCVQLGAFVSLIQDSNGNTVTYPCLKTLYAYAMDYSSTNIRESPEGTPFPALKHLTCAGEYPFNNDILFRGNSATLESLELTITPALLQAAQRYNVFEKGRYPRLHRVALESWSGFAMDDELALSVARIPFEVGPNVQVIKVNLRGDKRENVILDAIRLTPENSQIRFLNIQDFRLTVFEVVEVIKILPNLRDLKFWMTEEETAEQDSLSLDALAQLHTENHPVSTRLRSLQFESRANELARQTAANLLTVASLAPSLQYISMFGLLFDDCKAFFKDVVADPAFDKYAEHLRSIKYLSGLYRGAETIPLF